MKQYRKRVVDQILKDKLNAKGAVLIEGAKWCGKTTTASQIANSILYMQDPAIKEQNIRGNRGIRRKHAVWHTNNGVQIEFG